MTKDMDEPIKMVINKNAEAQAAIAQVLMDEVRNNDEDFANDLFSVICSTLEVMAGAAMIAGVSKETMLEVCEQVLEQTSATVNDKEY